MADERATETPHDRLTRLCAVAENAIKADPEYREGDQIVVMVDDEDFGGMKIEGYSGPEEIMRNVAGHMRAMLKAGEPTQGANGA